MNEGTPEGAVIDSIRVRHPEADSGEWLVVIKGRYEGRPVVAFHGAYDLPEALRGAGLRAANGELRWKTDDWAVEQEQRRLAGERVE